MYHMYHCMNHANNFFKAHPIKGHESLRIRFFFFALSNYNMATVHGGEILICRFSLHVRHSQSQLRECRCGAVQ